MIADVQTDPNDLGRSEAICARFEQLVCVRTKRTTHKEVRKFGPDCRDSYYAMTGSWKLGLVERSSGDWIVIPFCVGAITRPSLHRDQQTRERTS